MELVKKSYEELGTYSPFGKAVYPGDIPAFPRNPAACRGVPFPPNKHHYASSNRLRVDRNLLTGNTRHPPGRTPQTPPDDSCDNTHRFTANGQKYFDVILQRPSSKRGRESSECEARKEIHQREAYEGQLLPTRALRGRGNHPPSQIGYMHFRYFGSTMGRFCKPDNINGNLANPQSWNKYSYVVGNPVNFNDPTGHKWNIPGEHITTRGTYSWDVPPGSDDDQTSSYFYNMVDVLASINIAQPTLDKQNDDRFVSNLESLVGTKYVNSGGHEGILGAICSFFGVDCTGLVRTAINMTLKEAGKKAIGDFTTSTRGGKPILVGKGTSILREKQGTISRGDVIVLKRDGKHQHTVVSLGGTRYIEASGTKLHVIIVDTRKANNPGYRFRDQALQLNKYFRRPYTVYDVAWPK